MACAMLIQLSFPGCPPGPLNCGDKMAWEIHPKRGATHPHRSRFTKPNQFPYGFKQNISQSVMHFNFNKSCQQCAQQTWFEIQQQNNTNIMNWLTLSFAIWAKFVGNWTIPPSHTCVMQSNWADQHHDDKSISSQLNSVCASVNVSIPSTTPHKKCSSTFGLVVFFWQKCGNIHVFVTLTFAVAENIKEDKHRSCALICNGSASCKSCEHTLQERSINCKIRASAIKQINIG